MCSIRFQTAEKGLDAHFRKYPSIFNKEKFKVALTSNIRWPMHHHERVKLWSHIRRRCSECYLWSWHTVIIITTTRYHCIMAMLLLLLVVNISCILEVGITFNYWTSWNNTYHKTLQFKDENKQFTHTLLYSKLIRLLLMLNLASQNTHIPYTAEPLIYIFPRDWWKMV